VEPGHSHEKLDKKHADLCYPLVEQQRGNQELINFAMKSLKALIKQEEQGGNAKSNLRFFCRMDIGVMTNKSKYHYFVNGLSRSWDTAMFMTGDNSQLVQKQDYICQEFVRHLPMFSSQG
jgi:hypothetical protein